ncbi:hypothetical protein GCM10007857_65220 [Bradyrhizobium iriomotense]|uniref:DUF2188 domain-containing protein n=1 Tax=Bradyrhizobium iriomotense TaxID=441950 RepID=A0ABQ6B7Q1_9BRAD|nr:hypothetical protein GCM10007857_65220 [Bradyrhizobium iriomotense]
MARFRFFVTLHKDRGQWIVVLNGAHSVPYPTQKEAIRVAVDAAYKEGASGHDAQVLVQDEDNEVRTEWTYGHDPYPPAG